MFRSEYYRDPYMSRAIQPRTASNAAPAVRISARAANSVTVDKGHRPPLRETARATAAAPGRSSCAVQPRCQRRTTNAYVALASRPAFGGPSILGLRGQLHDTACSDQHLYPQPQPPLPSPASASRLPVPCRASRRGPRRVKAAARRSRRRPVGSKARPPGAPESLDAPGWRLH